MCSIDGKEQCNDIWTVSRVSGLCTGDVLVAEAEAYEAGVVRDAARRARVGLRGDKKSGLEEGGRGNWALGGILDKCLRIAK